ncbi:pentatricopeptide repeat-containing protein At1g02060, chloroplastic-like [Coffea arabica]|uniref:Pentatricopeptide repeat-containing protein At1g02060, chloroplastic-like n=1 Tax=Coffea arabica TaxID=13443 RepID=A0A6P6W6B9_COFAR|nr:pentatricopeptide repeat-containing protein At1g02060, chloroplastic-like [Coffea arabica]XP_027110535.1 pentatricopeptide repeat-containing protein At1g02060, chloroplastic-like [Coffea arabica]
MAANLSPRAQTFCNCKAPRPPPSPFIKHHSSQPETAAKNSNHKATVGRSNGHAQLSKSKSSSTKTKRARTMARLINARPWSTDLQASLAQSSLSQTTVLQTLRLITTPAKALHFFHWAYKSGFTHTPQSYFLMLELLCQARNFNSARNFLLSIPRKSNGAVQLEDKHFNCLIRAFGEAGLFKESLKIFKTMKSIGVSPSVITFNHLFSILLKRGRTGMVFELFDEMLETYGVEPDLYSFNILIRGFCKNSMVDEGFRFFKKMEKFNCQPDVIAYNTIIDGLCKDGRVKIAHNVMKGMLNKGPNLSPNIVTYTTLIRGYCEKLEIDEALDVFEEIACRGLKPNEITYNTLVQGLCEARMLNKVKEILDGCGGENGGFVPDTCTFNTLMNAHCSDGNLDGVFKIFQKMSELKVHPDSATYSMLIRSFCEKGNFEKAEGLFRELYEKEILLHDAGCTPLVASYNPMFRYLTESGKTEMAEKVFKQLLKRGRQDASAFKTIMMGHCREGTVKAAFEILVLMLRRDFVPDFETYESLIEGLLEEDEPILAHETLEKMLKSSHLPRTSIFHRTLARLVSKGCAHESFSMVMLMLEKKIRHNLNIATDTVIVLFKAGMRDKAFEVVRCLYEYGYIINMEELIIFLCKQRKLLEAREMLLFGTKSGQRVDLGVCNTVLNGLCKIKRVNEAFELYYELLEQGIQQPLSCLQELRVALEAEGRSKEAEFVSKRMLNQHPLNGPMSNSKASGKIPHTSR